MDDTTLIHNILARDKRALHSFYHTYTPQLARLLRAKIYNTHDAEEILQDTLYAFLEALRDFQGKSSIKTFLYAICHHKIIDYYRRKKISHFVFSQMPRLEALISPVLNPEQEFDAAEIAEKIQRVFRRILPQYRQVLLSKYMDDLSVEEIAKKFAVTFKSAESLLFRARKAFVEAFVAI